MYAYDGHWCASPLTSSRFVMITNLHVLNFYSLMQVLVASHITGLITLGTLARDSIQVSGNVILVILLTLTPFYSVLYSRRYNKAESSGCMGKEVG